MWPQTVELAMTDLSSDTLFDEAIEAIQNLISEDDRRTFRHHADVTSLVDDLRDISNTDQHESQRLQACSRKMILFSRTFAPYFDIVGKIDQVRPDWLGWFWGSIALVFKVGSNYVIFLERISDMFEAIAHVLPQCRRFHESRRYSNGSQDHQLVALMSYAYADIIQFCLELYQMFSRGSQGVELRHRSAVRWRPLDSRFAHLEKRLKRHRRWFEKEVEIQNLELLALHRKEYDDFIQAQSEGITNEEVEDERMARRLRRVDKIKAWLSNCCAYRDVYEHRIRQRHPDTCKWFLDTPKYCNWKNTPFDGRLANDTDELQTSWHERIVFVQAKPGFGKTFLSGQVIDDLTTGAEDLNISDEPPTIAFFHFNAAHLYCTHSNDAFRALAVQLVHAHRHDRSTLDALSLLMRKTATQEKASSDDVLSVCSLLLRQHSTFLVIDGIDECSDPDTFLTLLPELCRKSDARVLLFSRLNIKIPLMYQKWASDAPHIVTLDDAQNAADIEFYVTENLNRMADQGFFGISMDRSLIDNAASRANGSFLWVSLLLKYLQSPALSSSERRTALEEIHLLSGLEPLYQSILTVLSRHPLREKQVAISQLRWLSLSIRRLCLPGTGVALAITPGQPTTSDQYLSDVGESIPQLTGGLVEVTDCSVLFTHRSVKEYLQSPACGDSPFSLCDESNVHAHLAAKCLSFLAHDVPKRPLHRLTPYIAPSAPLEAGSGTSFRTSRSGDSGYKSMSSSDTDGPVNGTVVNAGVTERKEREMCFEEDVPFLRYAVLCWPIHLTRALSNTVARSPDLDPSIHTASMRELPWLPSLSHLLASRLALTAWVEASWRYSLSPNVSRLIPLLTQLKYELPPTTVEGRELRWCIRGLRDLSDALLELKEGFASSLSENPSLIWQGWVEGGERMVGMEGMEGLEGKRFWPVWDEREGRAHGVEV